MEPERVAIRIEGCAIQTGETKNLTILTHTESVEKVREASQVGWGF
jgi:hypothetical protein